MTARLLTADLRANFRHLYADIFWWGILSGSTAAFLAVFATRLGAQPFQISLLTAGPAGVNLLFSLHAGRWLEGKPLIPTTFWSALITRLGYLGFFILPWLVPVEGQVWGVVLITLLMSVPGTLVAISFNAMFADVVPAEWRADLVGKRNALMAISMTVTTLLCGQLLDRIAPPYNYPVVFALGALGAFMSAYHLSRLRGAAAPGEPAGNPGIHPATMVAHLRRLHFANLLRLPALRLPALRRPANGSPPITSPGNRKGLLRLDLLRGSFGSFLAALLVFYTCQYLPLPVFPLVFVRELHLSDSAISLGTSMFNATMFLGSLWLSRFGARYGHRRLMLAGTLGYSLYPLLLGLAGNATPYWIASLTGGGIWAIAGASLTNRLMERVPVEDRAAYMAQHNLVLNLGILAGSFAGPALGSQIGLQQALIVAAGLRMFAGLLLARWG